jgi:hypothetical protein
MNSSQSRFFFDAKHRKLTGEVTERVKALLVSIPISSVKQDALLSALQEKLLRFIFVQLNPDADLCNQRPL